MKAQTAMIGAAMALAGALAWGAGSAHFQLISKQSKSYASSSFFPASSPEVSVDRASNRISMGAVQDVRFTALAGPKQKMMSFQIDTLSNPEIRLAKGSRLTLNVVNVDDDMIHDLYITTQAPPYPSQLSGSDIGTAMLQPYKGKRYSGAVLILKASQPGTAYYVCTVKGHAKAGMFGKITVLP